jgi:rhodanese-related sulfurtransferase
LNFFYWNICASNMSSVQVVDPKEALRLSEQDGWKLLDVRYIEEYDREYCYSFLFMSCSYFLLEGHARGSRCIPYMIKEGEERKPNSLFIPEVKKVFQPSDKILVCCNTGRRASTAAEALKEAGYLHVANIGGGFSKWSSEQLPIDK